MRQWIGAPRTGAEYGLREDARFAAVQKAKALRTKLKIPRVREMRGLALKRLAADIKGIHADRRAP